MNGTDQIAAHLRGRPFAEIFEQSHEKDNVIALKLMCILDFQMEQLNLYTKIQATKPKLLGLLLQFSSFASFKYYDYAVKKEIGARVVRCKFCDLVGPYANILTHMAINHNTHVGMKMCLYCNRVELENHFTEKSLDPCYQKYLRQNETNDGKFNPKVLEIVTGFFAMLKKLSKTLDIHSVRQKQYTGLGYRAVEKLNQNYGDDFPNECTVFKQPARKVKDISTSLGLDMEVHRALSYFYGSCDSTRSPAQHQQTSNHAVVIDAQPQNIPADNGHQFHVSFYMNMSNKFNYSIYAYTDISLDIPSFFHSVWCIAQKRINGNFIDANANRYSCKSIVSPSIVTHNSSTASR